MVYLPRRSARCCMADNVTLFAVLNFVVEGMIPTWTDIVDIQYHSLTYCRMKDAASVAYDAADDGATDAAANVDCVASDDVVVHGVNDGAEVASAIVDVGSAEGIDDATNVLADGEVASIDDADDVTIVVVLADRDAAKKQKKKKRVYS